MYFFHVRSSLQTLANGSHPQRDDNVPLFGMLRDSLEHIKAGTLGTRTIQIICRPGR
jgi:hypothetical protein